MNKETTIKSTVTKDNSRDYLFDNLRAIFIILVVWGHVLTSMMGKSDIIKSIYFFVFFFHMPAMAFVSGYFSKNLEKIRSNVFVTILIPYLILNVINYSYKMVVIQEHYYGFRFFRPYWGLWYLLVLFLWKFFLKDLVKIRFLLPLSFLFAILSGFTKEFSDYMALGRMICFLPFFLLGFYCTKEHVEKIRRIPKLVSIAVIAITGALSTYIVFKDVFKVEVLYLRRPYPADADVKSMVFRILVYIVAIAMIIAIMNITTAKKTFLSIVGTSTMTVYVLHLFTIPLLEKLEILKEQPYLYLLYSFFMTAAIVFIYTRPLVKRIYDTFMDKLSGLIIKKS
jgi:fucose 4-O-acetylase-like acetyltransferase